MALLQTEGRTVIVSAMKNGLLLNCSGTVSLTGAWTITQRSNLPIKQRYSTFYRTSGADTYHSLTVYKYDHP